MRRGIGESRRLGAVQIILVDGPLIRFSETVGNGGHLQAGTYSGYLSLPILFQFFSRVCYLQKRVILILKGVCG